MKTQTERTTQILNIANMVTLEDDYEWLEDEWNKEPCLEYPGVETDIKKIATVKMLLRQEAEKYPEVEFPMPNALLRVILNEPVCNLVKIDDLETHLSVRRILRGSQDENTVILTDDPENFLNCAIIWQIMK